ncbi:hypothetical protein I6A84_10385 [Frankia sp. CNm7]|uniref:MaoC-like domain-containing protein n=2 Tax=Frankia nepalensis TaxID=1836974 RepID=A0A937RGL6_9ACTN|nr:hypothetical protein [Frankia nepalensis]MBL7516217.1 hypothetical protein [Frankia nepalensis]MBL7518507.1 hypothetical protein [Frankia nepalensis]MBL7625691.1 hypothetical protein [Frankia nepalensis]
MAPLGAASPPGPLALAGPDALRAAVGVELGPTRPVVIGADRVEAFETATGAPAVSLPAGLDGTSPGRQVPGLLLLALVNYILPRLVDVRGFQAGINYGTGPVRFPVPLAVGCSVRGSLVVVETADVPGGVAATYRVTLIRASTGEVVCVADSLARYLF